ncbi:MAG: hypothetical protein ACOC1G_09290, partial [Phycisphaeraceae bacterium]
MQSDASRMTWFRRNRRWFIPVALGVPLAALSLGFAITAGVVMHQLKQTQPFRLALAEVRASGEVAQWTGRPMEPGWIVQGSIEEQSGATTDPASEEPGQPAADAVANLMFTVEGPDGGAGVRVYATRQDDRWTLQYIDAGVKRGDQENIIVVVDTGERPPEA